MTNTPSIYDEDLDVHDELDGAFARAQAADRRVLVVMGGDWCPDCRVLDAMAARPEISARLAELYETVKFSVGRYDKNLDAVERLGFSELKGAPAVLVFTAAGEAVERSRAYDWRTARSRAPSEFLAAMIELSAIAPDPSDRVAVRREDVTR
ncbi:MAG: thioredoxin family protein [Oceanicaulis sp.]